MKKHASSIGGAPRPLLLETRSPFECSQGRSASTATPLVSPIESSRGASGNARESGATSARLSHRVYHGKHAAPSGSRKAQRSHERSSLPEEEEEGEGSEPSGSRARAAFAAEAAWASAVAAATAASRRARWSAERGGIAAVEVADPKTAWKNFECERATRLGESHMKGLMIWSSAKTFFFFFAEGGGFVPMV